MEKSPPVEENAPTKGSEHLGPLFRATFLAREFANNAKAAAQQSAETVDTLDEVVARSEASLTNLGASVRDVKANAQQVQMIAVQAANIATRSATHMERLDEFVGDIDSVSEEIKKIARTTHLLALNAAVEAEHAGEAGAGFAVVASEVKGLARSTGELADTIHQKIQGVSSTIHEAGNGFSQLSQAISLIQNVSDATATSVESHNSASGGLESVVGVVQKASKTVVEELDRALRNLEILLSTLTVSEADPGGSESR